MTTPPTPKIGGLVKVSDTLSIPWTGGVPSAAWDASGNLKASFFSCYRPAPGSTDYSKTMIAVTKPIDKKFEVGDSTYPLAAFESAVWTHLRNTGMDSIFHVFDVDAVEMVEIVHRHSRFLLSHVRDFVAGKSDMSQKDSYDSYDVENLSLSRAFFLKVLAPT